MDAKQKKQMISEYKAHRSEMGVIAVRCTATGETFLGTARDTKAEQNSLRFKLGAGMHPNKALQALWSKHGENAFVISVLQTLEQDDPAEKHMEKLEALLEQCLRADPEAKRLK